MAFSKGFDGIDEAVKESEARRVSGPNRFWIKPGQEKAVSFIDGEGVRFPEHRYQIGMEKQYVHCIGLPNGCPFCFDNKFKYYNVTVFTVIDHTPFQTKDGKAGADRKIILAAREEQALALRDLSNMVGGLKGKRVLVRRANNQQSPAWGSSFTLEMRNGQQVTTNWKSYDPQVLTPFNYEQVYAPKPLTELEALYRHAKMNADNSFGSNAAPASNQWGSNQGFAQNQGQQPQQSWGVAPQQGVSLNASQTNAVPVNAVIVGSEVDKIAADIPF